MGKIKKKKKHVSINLGLLEFRGTRESTKGLTMGSGSPKLFESLRFGLFILVFCCLRSTVCIFLYVCICAGLTHDHLCLDSLSSDYLTHPA